MAARFAKLSGVLIFLRDYNWKQSPSWPSTCTPWCPLTDLLISPIYLAWEWTLGRNGALPEDLPAYLLPCYLLESVLHRVRILEKEQKVTIYRELRGNIKTQQEWPSTSVAWESLHGLALGLLAESSALTAHACCLCWRMSRPSRMFSGLLASTLQIAGPFLVMKPVHN